MTAGGAVTSVWLYTNQESEYRIGRVPWYPGSSRISARKAHLCEGEDEDAESCEEEQKDSLLTTRPICEIYNIDRPLLRESQVDSLLLGGLDPHTKLYKPFPPFIRISSITDPNDTGVKVEWVL
jgi:hypothetical protein